MKPLCKSEAHDEGDWEGQRSSEVQGPRLALEIKSSNPQQPALGKSD